MTGSIGLELIREREFRTLVLGSLYSRRFEWSSKRWFDAVRRFWSGDRAHQRNLCWTNGLFCGTLNAVSRFKGSGLTHEILYGV
ncbi:MAG: hypothetical protein ACOVLE_04205, partial [Pirellula staleyi]